MRVDEFTIQVNEGIVSDIMAHFQGRQLADRKGLYNLLLAMKQRARDLPEEQQLYARKLIDRFTKYTMQKQFANAKKTYDELYSILRGV